MKARILSMLVVLLLLSGWGPIKYKTPDEVYTKTTFTHDPYKKSKWIKGPSVKVDHATQKPSAM